MWLGGYCVEKQWSKQTYLHTWVQKSIKEKIGKKKDKRQTTKTHMKQKKKRVLGIGNRPTGLCTNDDFKVLLTSHIQATKEIKSRLLPKFKF